MTRTLTALIASLTFGTFLAGQTPPANSPFVKPSNGTAKVTPVADQPTDLKLSGISSIGGTTLVCITVVAEKRSHWIKVGESAARIHILSHDPQSGQVAIKYNGQTLNLELTKPTFDPAAIARYSRATSGPLPTATVALPVAVTNKQKAAEARHLVSDLLEIGIIQREAYRRAERGLPPEDEEKKKP